MCSLGRRLQQSAESGWCDGGEQGQLEVAGPVKEGKHVTAASSIASPLEHCASQAFAMLDTCILQASPAAPRCSQQGSAAAPAAAAPLCRLRHGARTAPCGTHAGVDSFKVEEASRGERGQGVGTRNPRREIQGNRGHDHSGWYMAARACGSRVRRAGKAAGAVTPAAARAGPPAPRGPSWPPAAPPGQRSCRRRGRSAEGGKCPRGGLGCLHAGVSTQRGQGRQGARKKAGRQGQSSRTGRHSRSRCSPPPRTRHSGRPPPRARPAHHEGTAKNGPAA